ncbi:hypothetical protein AYI68_g4755, partial [Smittium mucronatum]
MFCKISTVSSVWRPIGLLSNAARYPFPNKPVRFSTTSFNPAPKSLPTTFFVAGKKHLPLLPPSFSYKLSAPCARFSSKSHSEQNSQEKKTWFWIPVKYGLAYICLQQLYHLVTDYNSSDNNVHIQKKPIEGPWH